MLLGAGEDVLATAGVKTTACRTGLRQKRAALSGEMKRDGQVGGFWTWCCWCGVRHTTFVESEIRDWFAMAGPAGFGQLQMGEELYRMRCAGDNMRWIAMLW